MFTCEQRWLEWTGLALFLVLVPMADTWLQLYQISHPGVIWWNAGITCSLLMPTENSEDWNQTCKRDFLKLDCFCLPCLSLLCSSVVSCGPSTPQASVHIVVWVQTESNLMPKKAKARIACCSKQGMNEALLHAPLRWLYMWPVHAFVGSSL